MNIQTTGEDLIVKGASYSIIIGTARREFSYYRREILLYTGKIDVLLDTLEFTDEPQEILSYTHTQKDESIEVVFKGRGGRWVEKSVIFICHQDYFMVMARVEGVATGITDIRYFASGVSVKTPGSRALIAPRFDWFVGKIQRRIDEDELLSCQQWFSPPPFSYIYTDEGVFSAVGVAARKGDQNFTAFLHTGKDDSFVLQYEGHCPVKGIFITPSLVFCPDAMEWDGALRTYRDVLERERCLVILGHKRVPQWWREPIFCGWGEMRYEYRADHDDHENGNFVNVTDYCTQRRYERYLDALEREGVHPGTVIIDMGWAEQVAFGKPDTHKWPDMRSFIDRQHEKGRHVLLWFTPMVTQGLAAEACLMLQGRAVAPDPTNPVYVDILNEQLSYMLSSGPEGLDADGFKIDFTQNNPSEQGVFTGYLNSFWGLINTTNEKHLYSKRDQRSELIRVHDKNVWGIELLHRYLENIYKGMKAVKAESLLITHTPNPYFTDVSDMIRLNDLDGECDNVLEVMSSRAKIASAINPSWLIDTDNDLMIDRNHWRQYIALQPCLGIPDTYYATHIATSMEAFTTEDYALLRQIFEDYRAALD